jgi:YgiT-type zinc finger domain-containing protein
MKTTEERCFECEGGNYHPVTEDFEVETPEGKKIVVPSVPLLRCDRCGDTVVTPEATRYIQDYIVQFEGILPRTAIKEFLEEHQINQSEAAEVLGLGEKTINRWLNGRQMISKSMSYYLRVLWEFPETFEWLKRREWTRYVPRASSVRIPSSHKIKESESTAFVFFHRKFAGGVRRTRQSTRFHAGGSLPATRLREREFIPRQKSPVAAFLRCQ